MKVAQLKKILDQTAQMYRETGDSEVGESLRVFSAIFAGRETMTVASFAKLVDKTLAYSLDE